MMNQYESTSGSSSARPSLGMQADRVIEAGRKVSLISLGLLGMVFDRGKALLDDAESRGSMMEQDLQRLRRETEARLMARGAEVEQTMRSAAGKLRTRAEHAVSPIEIDIRIGSDPYAGSSQTVATTTPATTSTTPSDLPNAPTIPPDSSV